MKLPELSSEFPRSFQDLPKVQDKLRPLKVADLIWMQDHSGKWPYKGEIISVNKRGRTYVIKLEDGRTFV